MHGINVYMVWVYAWDECVHGVGVSALTRLLLLVGGDISKHIIIIIFTMMMFFVHIALL